MFAGIMVIGLTIGQIITNTLNAGSIVGLFLAFVLTAFLNFILVKTNVIGRGNEKNSS
ncbi:hypothetical protein [Jeotgalibacillus sp. ET6]|uniref:hypothetical protein n=1 Tax=Jeotgalibacillus sp. ET6 TaxID=3037260 RepID=UPI0024184C6D|nr:hypothetical protein [Jeotgalibacillus sp. ET6]